MSTPRTPPAPAGATEDEQAAWLASADQETRTHVVRLLRFAIILVECIETRGWTLAEFVDWVDATLEWRTPDRSQIA